MAKLMMTQSHIPKNTLVKPYDCLGSCGEGVPAIADGDTN